jgi:hypothetical protein
VSLQRRLEKLEARSPAHAVGRLFFLLPELWPEDDRAAFDALSGEVLADLVERRTGVRPVLETGQIWAVIAHMPVEARAWDAATKAAFLENHETRPLAPWQRTERER